MTWLAVLCLLFHQQSVQMMEDFWTNYWARCGGVQSCLSQLFLHYPIFQNHKQGFDLQSKPPHGRMVLMGSDRVQKFTRCE